MNLGFIANIACNHSILIAAIIGIFRFKSITEEYYPFLYFIWAGLFNDTLSLALILNHDSNTLSSNIFILIESLLLLWIFYKWNDGNKKKYFWFATVFLSVWVLDNFVFNSLKLNNSIFRVFYSFAIILFSIDRINKILIFENGDLLKNAMFIICITFLFYYGYKVFVESFNMFPLGLSKSFLNTLWLTLSFVNLIANFLYAFAVLWMPTKRKFILHY